MGFAADSQFSKTITGYWQTVDGKTKKPSSIVAIMPTGNYFFGKIIKTYPPTGKKRISICTKCKDARKNQPIIGLPIILHMTCSTNFCHGGTILDPRNGDVYKGTMQLMQQGAILKVRGYIGIPMFGKTVYWRRVSKP